MKESIFKKFLTWSTILLLSAGVAQAATVNIVRVADNPHETVHGIRDNTGTEGRDLHGALIKATYVDGSSEDFVWRSLNFNTDGRADTADVQGNIWDGFTSTTGLFMGWDGFELSTSRQLTSLLIDVAPASTVFDTTFIFDDDPAGGSTPSSSFGSAFDIYAGGDALQGSITATYSGIVNLAGHAAEGDLFTRMLVDFSGLSTGGFLGQMSFRSDLDTMRYAGDLAPSQVPLPASLPLLMVGLGGFALSRRRSRC